MRLAQPPFGPVTEAIHGVAVVDPYRWLEDRGLSETDQWIQDQQRRCDEYFAKCCNLDSLRDRVRDYLDVEIADQPVRVAGRYFYRRRNQGEEQASIYVREIVSGQERKIIDPSDQGPFASISIHRISEDGSLLAYESHQGGGDRKAIQILDVDRGILLDKIDEGYARGFAFASDNSGFFYCHETPGDSEDKHKIQLHRFHESKADQTVFCAPRSPGSRLTLTSDEIHLGALAMRIEGSELVGDFFIARKDCPLRWRRVFAGRLLPYNPILKSGRVFVLSYDNAPHGKLMELGISGCEICTVVPDQNAVIRQFIITGDRVYFSYLSDMIPSTRCWTLSGVELTPINVPKDGTIQLLPNKSYAENSLFYSFESFFQPPTIFEYVPSLNESRLWYRRPLSTSDACSNVRSVSVRSKDGTQIPMTIASRRVSESGFSSPVIMTGYGGFGVPVTPQFSVLVSVMLELGAEFALPQIRGGGEFGKPWHDAARGRNRQVAFDDFLATAEWLKTSETGVPRRLAIFGGSNSGLLVGVAMTQRPELFSAVLCIAPLLDMVRYECFDQATKWRLEYGTVEKREDFNALFSYSPYHHVRDTVDYPAVLFVSGDKDDRCNPSHVRKMAARLQERRVQTHPVLVDYSLERGHSPVLPLMVRVEALALRIAFLAKELDLSIPRRFV
jgi:prolyl oligopeptidase